MKRIVCGTLLLMGVSLMAQQQSPPPFHPTPNDTTPTFPQEQRPGEQMPPDTRAPMLSNIEIQKQIEKKISTEPILASSEVQTTVEDDKVVLSGTVEDEPQHEMALRIAESYAGDRQIVDKIVIRQKT